MYGVELEADETAWDIEEQDTGYDGDGREEKGDSVIDYSRLPQAAQQALENVQRALRGELISLSRPWRSSIEFVETAPQEIEWLIPGVLPAGAVVLLSGREGSMKSWLAMTMARAIAAGVPWLGKQTKQGPVLYLDGEMQPALLQDRLRGIGPVDQLHIWTWTDPTFPEQLNGNANLIEAARGHKLIVVDTLRRFMNGRKENSADDMAEVTNALRELTRYGATVLALHHAPKDIEKQGYRGSTELGAGVDVTVSVVKQGTEDKSRLDLKNHKTRYSFSTDLVIQVTKGERAPVFTLGRLNEKDDPKRGLKLLRLLIIGLRQQLERNPIQSEILTKAKGMKLGAKDKILRWLEEGEGSYWRSEEIGNRRAYEALDIQEDA
jgi:hypothetical protein